VRQVKQTIEGRGFDVATPDEVRTILQLKGGGNRVLNRH
jgi:uncharacterized protein (DUF849 family)